MALVRTKIAQVMLIGVLVIGSFAGCANHAPLLCFDVTGSVAERTAPCFETSAMTAIATELVVGDEQLTEDEAIALSLVNNPAFQELLADLDISQADVILAHQLTNPELLNLFPLGVKQWELTLMVPLDVLMLRPRRVAAAQLESERVADRLVQDGLNLVRDVRVAYTDLAQREQNLAITQEIIRLRREISRVAEARLNAGDVSELDVASTRLEDGLTEEQLIRDQRGIELARARLQFLMGDVLPSCDITTTPLPDAPPLHFEPEVLVAEAINSRPDLVAIDMAIAAASERAHLAYYDYFNIWAALPDINGRGAKGFEAGPGLRMALPIFHQNQGIKARTAADVDRLQRQYVRQQNQIALEVRLAATQLTQAQEQLALSREKVLPQAKAASEAATAALEEDGASILLLLETSRQLLDAKLRQVQASADVHRALAELERSVGHRLDCQPESVVTEELEAPEPDMDVVEEATP